MELDGIIKMLGLIKDYDGYGMGTIMAVFLWTRFSFRPFKNEMKKDVQALNEKLKEHIKVETKSIEEVKKEVNQIKLILAHLLTKIDPTNEDWKVLK